MIELYKLMIVLWESTGFLIQTYMTSPYMISLAPYFHDQHNKYIRWRPIPTYVLSHYLAIHAPYLPSHTCPSHTSVHLCCPPHLISKEKHPHLLTKHVHITYIQRQAHIITHPTWLIQPLQHITYLIHPTYMNLTPLSIPHYSAPPLLPISHKFAHSIVCVYHILPTHVAITLVTIQPSS